MTGAGFLRAARGRGTVVAPEARAECCRRQFEVIRHFYGDGDDVHRGAVHKVMVIVERERYTKEFAGGVGRFAAAGGQRRDLEVIRERLQSRNCAPAPPSAPGNHLIQHDSYELLVMGRGLERREAIEQASALLRLS